MTNVGIKFDGSADKAFATELRAAVGAHFKDSGLSRQATPGMWAKAAFMISLLFGLYALLLSGVLPLWGAWLASAGLGAAVAAYGFTVMHDAMHGTFHRDPRVNNALGFVLDLVGASSYVWQLRHDTMHHAYTNVYGADVDLDASFVLRLSPYADWLPLHRAQRVYAYALYSLTSLHWVLFKDYRSLLLRAHGPYRGMRHPPLKVAKVLGMKLLYYVHFIVVPLLVLDITVTQFLVGFFTMHLVGGFMLTMVFQLAHVVDKTEHFERIEGATLAHGWMAHELKVTTNFACESRWVTWWVGGLNHQIEHHLFPTIASVHLPALRPIVKAVAARHGLPYHEHATVAEALAAHHKLLVELGEEPERQVACAPQVAGA